MERLKWAVGGILAVVMTMMSTGSVQRVGAQEPKVIEVTAKRFEFVPNTVTLKKGETVKLRLHSEDVAHGFFSRQLKIDETVEPGKSAEVTVTPQTAGTFKTICDRFCGSGHGNMAMTIVVE